MDQVSTATGLDLRLVIILAAGLSALVTAVVSPLVTLAVSRFTRRRDERARLLTRWREALGAYTPSERNPMTAMSLFPEITSALRANRIECDVESARTMHVPAYGTWEDAVKAKLHDCIAKLAKKWGLE